MKIALAQLTCIWGEVAENLKRMQDCMEQAAAAGAALVAFPELTVSGICKDPRIFDLAETQTGPSLTRVCEMARRYEVGATFGFTECSAGKPYNAYCLVDRGGRLCGVYRKQFVPTLEAPFWQAGNAQPVFSFMGLQTAVSICWDNTHPELLAAYAAAGANVVIMPHAWDADALDVQGRVVDFLTMEEITEAHQTGRIARWKTHDEMLEFFLGYIPELARRHGFWALFVNQCGRPHPNLDFPGPSFAVDPQGQVVVCTRNRSESLLYLEIPETRVHP